jgi:hypothetical protein
VRFADQGLSGDLDPILSGRSGLALFELLSLVEIATGLTLGDDPGPGKAFGGLGRSCTLAQ